MVMCTIKRWIKLLFIELRVTEKNSGYLFTWVIFVSTGEQMRSTSRNPIQNWRYRYAVRWYLFYPGLYVRAFLLHVRSAFTLQFIDFLFRISCNLHAITVRTVPLRHDSLKYVRKYWNQRGFVYFKQWINLCG